MAMLKSAAGAAVALLVVLALVMDAQAQGCVSISELLPCRSAVTAVNGALTPACCAEVKKVLQMPNGAKCLCEAMTSSTATAVRVIKAEAIKLPSRCRAQMGLQYAPGYNCGGTCVTTRARASSRFFLFRRWWLITWCSDTSRWHRFWFCFAGSIVPWTSYVVFFWSIYVEIWEDGTVEVRRRLDGCVAVEMFSDWISVLGVGDSESNRHGTSTAVGCLCFHKW